MSNIMYNRLIKTLQILFVVVMLLSVGLIAAACQCEHEYESKITKPATCSSAGEITYTCGKCGDFYTEELSMLEEHNFLSTYQSDLDVHWQECSDCGYATAKIAHEYATIVSSEPSTCVVAGSIAKLCVCGKVDVEFLPLAEHNYVIYQTQGDKHWLKCGNCDSTTAEEEHEFNIQGAVTPSTCVEHGTKVTSCVCGEMYTEELPLAQHSYTKTLFDDDEHWTVCSLCNDENVNQARVPHSLTTETTDPDCVKTGKTVTSCIGCGYNKTDTVPARGHDLDKTEFSSSSTGSGHYYKCNRCNKDIAEPHSLEDCECPDGSNRAATCYKAGHQDQQCSICNWRNHFTTSMTGEHNWSNEWTYNGTFHWHVCLNGNGACSAHGDETQHVWADVVVKEPSCTENGSCRKVCECGAEQSGSNTTINKLGHDYEIIEVITEATCEHDGLVKECCKRCQDEVETVVKRLDHVMDAYESTIEGHQRKCVNCGFTQTTVRNHTWNDNVVKEATCEEDGLTIRTCEYCKFTYEQTTTRNHSYVTDPNSYVDATCKSYQTHVGTCSQCGNTQTFVDEYLGYANHSVEYHRAKEMTATEPGNRPYWQCTVCDKYFTSHGCVEELTAEQVFTYPPTLTQIESIEKLIEAAQNIPNEVASDGYYQVTATVEDVYTNEHTLMIGDGESIFASLIDRENIKTIIKNNVITLKGKLFKSDDDVMLVDCEVVSVDCGTSGICSISISMTEGYEDIVYIYAATDEKDSFGVNTNHYNCLLEGDEITFYAYAYDSDVVIQKIIINGKAYTMVDGVLTIPVAEDIIAEFVIARTNKTSVRINSIDTSNNQGEAIQADSYISYTYTNGGYNDDGRLHKDSHLTFSVNNANITGINITYEVQWLADNPKVLENTVNAIKANGYKVSVEQGSANGNSQITITLDTSETYTALEYFANVSQARVVEIIILYETYNTAIL